MKFLNVLFLAAGLLLMSSCGDDDPTPEELIVGVWNLSSIVDSGCTDPDNNDNTVFGDAGCVMDGDDVYCATATATFTAPSTVVINQIITENGTTVDTDVQNGTYSFDENGLLTICFDGECDSGTLTVTETTMGWVGVADSEGCVTTVSGSK